MAGPGSVDGVVIPPGVQADHVERDGEEYMLEVHFLQAAVAGVTDSGHRDSLVDGALDAGAQRVLGLPGLGVLDSAGLVLSGVHVAGVHGELAAPFPGGGAVLTHGAWPAGGASEADHDGVGAALGDRVP
jgi:hypothetical protein